MRWFTLLLTLLISVGCAAPTQTPGVTANGEQRPDDASAPDQVQAPLSRGDFLRVPTVSTGIRAALEESLPEEMTPYLERVHLLDGRRERLMDMPPEVTTVALSPGGRFIALQTWEQRSDRHGNRWPTGAWVADLQEKSLTLAPLEAVELKWRDNNTLLNLGKGAWGEKAGWDSWHPASADPPKAHSERIRLAAISPDGKYAAFLDPSEAQSGRQGFDSPASVPLHIVDLDTGREQVISDFVQDWYVGSGGDHSRWVAWSPDGRLIAALDPLERTERAHVIIYDLVVYDLQAAERRVILDRVSMGRGGYRLEWSPDGQNLLAVSPGYDSYIISLDGSPLIRLPQWDTLSASWDDSGSRVLSATAQWGEVYVLTPATGELITLGDGWPVGWQGEWVYVIRWPGSKSRYLPPSP